MGKIVEELFADALDAVETVFSPPLSAAGFELRASSAKDTVASALFSDSKCGVLIGVDFHDMYIYIYFVHEMASLESAQVLAGGIALPEVIDAANKLTKRQDLKILRRSTNPYDAEKLSRRLREVQPILCDYLEPGRGLIATT